MNEENKALTGQWFNPSDEELKILKKKGHKLSKDFNNTYEDEIDKREEILKELLGNKGKNLTVVGSNIFFHYGIHTFIGDNCFLNTGFTCQDDTYVRIGNNCNFGPNCTIVTPIHPLSAEERIPHEDGKFYCKALPVTIEDDVWCGACVTILPGVHVGKGSVIGAGSVVTKDIGSGVLAFGNPCREIRKIEE